MLPSIRNRAVRVKQYKRILHQNLRKITQTISSATPIRPKDSFGHISIKGFSSVIVYNRVPKCASETIRLVFREQSDIQKFNIINSAIYAPFDYNTEEQQKIVNEVYNTTQPILYERHMYFINFSLFEKPQPIYINVVRDPLERSISAFYFTRTTCRLENRCYLNLDYLNDTLDDCINIRHKLNPEECLSSQHGVSHMIPFFCGQDPKCQLINDWSLQQAKTNIMRHYTIVGVTEQLYDFFFVLGMITILISSNYTI
ncbi:unnamed protein product [Didymodactylos carnosus]|uniref:Uncharacterized protein n=1 Tax=Didymodactylos carnosus TaxID=1234261 RepID=A0A815TEW0_9BILA|nr:unnamed protein product [Didymodactylos carnosus]CAF1504292.1 unnamed protein product [Didymodactylos carnosus]CAF4288360.1 unnamed protein product [Didymodactylos carnosus]CAF4365646.1 unnamed protein product [Didymodactylos carnosus]